MKRIVITLLTLALTLLAAAALADTTLMVASDLHYLAPSLCEGSELFLRAVSQGDGKVPQYSAELLRALVDEALEVRPDALLLTGDLTYNGERRSHEELAAAMDTLWDAGIPVYVIPGNHDINSSRAYDYTGETFEPVPAVTPEEFRQIWRRCMGEPESADRMSYHVELNDGVWLVMLDVSVYEDAVEAYGFYSEEMQEWLRPLMAEAAAKGVTAVSATHQSLIPQSGYRPGSYGIYNREHLQADLRAGGVTLNLSGHIHVMHIIREDGLTDAATGSMCVSPHCWGLVTIPEDGEPRYARRTLSCLSEDLRAATAAWFDANTRRQSMGVLETLEITPEEKEAMLGFGLWYQASYFGGVLPGREALTADPACALWEKYAPDSGFMNGMRTTLNFEENHDTGERP
ncbi:MAG: metallophosphoesterase [Clostridia bacterium]|nr:metallophosphoesterase [Clostridia bacterium]